MSWKYKELITNILRFTQFGSAQQTSKRSDGEIHPLNRVNFYTCKNHFVGMSCICISFAKYARKVAVAVLRFHSVRQSVGPYVMPKSIIAFQCIRTHHWPLGLVYITKNSASANFLKASSTGDGRMVGPTDRLNA